MHHTNPQNQAGAGMYAEERQSAVAAQVTRQGRSSVVELAERFEVSSETIRRDLLVLERAGVLRRVHGGAVSAGTPLLPERTLPDRAVERAAEKDAIAALALTLLPRVGTVLVDAGTTTSRLAAGLPADSRLTVVTHALPVAGLLADHPGCELHLLPGRLRPTTQAVVGPDTIAALGRLRVDVAVVATNALSVEHGLSTPDHDEAATKRALVSAARRVVVVADSSKVGEEAAVRFADLADVDTLVTDAGIADGHRARFEQAGVEVLVA